ncbi:MAG: hypothetical protein IT247_08060 [Bacteroidia bacterium]|nr:hypothetical protein [Bacteroidia bacterium]
MSITIKEALSEKELKAFVKLPFKIYRNNRYWVPHLISQEYNALIPERNPAFEFCHVKWWLAYKDGEVVGRLGGIINTLWNEKKNEKTARFTRFEVIDDIEVSRALLNTAENWARTNGMNRIQGPLGFTNLDHQGMLVEGFDHLPSVASVYHMPYYHKHVEQLGYTKEVDWVEFRLTTREIPEKALRLNELIKERFGLKLVSFTSYDELKKYAHGIFHLLNEAFAELFSVVPLNDHMRDYYVNKYMTFLNPRLVKVVLDKEEQMVGFIIGMPSLSEAMQKANGKLWPFGWWYLKKALQKPKVMDLILTGVHPKMQAQGVPAILITELQKSMLDMGIYYTETTGMFETNEKAIQVWKNYEHIQHKRKRCYIKAL